MNIISRPLTLIVWCLLAAALAASASPETLTVYPDNENPGTILLRWKVDPDHPLADTYYIYSSESYPVTPGETLRKLFQVGAPPAGDGELMDFGAYGFGFQWRDTVDAPAERMFYLVVADTKSYPIVDTDQQECYNTSTPITCPAEGSPFYGQDARYDGSQPAYVDNGDRTISDSNTGLMWVQARGEKMSWEDAFLGTDTCAAGGYSDWRMPSIKELYSLILFSGYTGTSAAASSPYLDTNYFNFEYGNTSIGERFIDCQDWSATQYVHFTMGDDSTVFGVNFADGRIKGYPKYDPFTGGTVPYELFVRYVRDNPDYGVNDFSDNGDGTITDHATGLMWQADDDSVARDWEDALDYAENLTLAGYDDWRLPNAKELQSIVDYTRSPATTDSPALDPIFTATELANGDYPWYWTGTTHQDGGPGHEYEKAVYVCFGRATGWIEMPPGSGNWNLLDVHGAGAQRSDPKFGNPDDYPHGFGPQGDVIRIFNHVRCVRGR